MPELLTLLLPRSHAYPQYSLLVREWRSNFRLGRLKAPAQMLCCVALSLIELLLALTPLMRCGRLLPPRNRQKRRRLPKSRDVPSATAMICGNL